MQNKEELKDGINELPLFEKRMAGVANSTEEKETEFSADPGSMVICEVDKQFPTYAYVKKSYHLVQFKDVFDPIMNSIEGELKGCLRLYGGYCSLLIFPESDKLKDGNNRFGLVAANSVDYSSGISVRFCVDHDGRQITIPPEIAGLKKKHTKGAGSLVKDYMGMIGPVKEFWAKIITEFPKYKIVMEENEFPTGPELVLRDVTERLELRKRLTKEVIEHYNNITYEGKTFSLWDVFCAVIDKLDEKKYKSEVHRQKRLDKLCTAIYDYSILLSI